MTAHHYTNLKIYEFPMGMLIFRQKYFLILYPPLENSTTSIAIMTTGIII